MNNRVDVKITRAVCTCVLCIIFVAGLWPFHAPKNQVKWLQNENGLRFGRYGSVLSSGALHAVSEHDDSSGSLEVWLEPALLGSKHTILSFDGSDHPGVALSLHQYGDALAVYRYYEDHGTARTGWVLVNDVFREKKPVLVTITMGKQDTWVYLDGALAKVSRLPGPSENNLTGRLVLANSPNVTDSWSGTILGLGIYPRQLSLSQVAQHYVRWTENPHALVHDDSPVALYLFDQGHGTVVRNEIDSAISLTIPERYFVLHPRFLSSPKNDYRPTWSYWEDVAVNIAGFIPLGACTVAYFTVVRFVRWPAALATLIGFSTSLTIEVLQAYLPTRSSGVTDLISNTIGTAVGVFLCRLVAQGRVEKARPYGNEPDAVTTNTDWKAAVSG